MKIEIYMDKKNGEDEEDMPRKPSAFHKKVAKMLAKQRGKKRPDEMDMKKAMELDEEDES